VRLPSTARAQAGEIESALESVENAARGIKCSKRLGIVMATVLALGNHLNGGTARGGAYGFKLNTLTKLINTKTTDNKMNLLHYLIEILMAQVYVNAADSGLGRHRLSPLSHYCQLVISFRIFWILVT
jgi:hypothetical protein